MHLAGRVVPTKNREASSATASGSIGFFQIGGGIAGDFAICAVPTIIQDLKRRRRAVLGLLRADLRRGDELRRLFGCGAEREDHLGASSRSTRRSS